MPEEIAIIVSLSILSGTLITLVKTFSAHRLQRLQMMSTPRSESARDGMTESELKRMISDAVTDATLPLHEKIDDLGRQVRGMQAGRVTIPEAEAWQAAGVDEPLPEKTAGKVR